MKTLNIFVLASIFVTFVNCNAIPESSSLIKGVWEAVNLSNIKVLEDNLVKRKVNDDELACNNGIEQYSDCLDFSKSKEVCKNVSTERCQKFLNDPTIYIPSCEKVDKALSKIIISKIKTTKSLENLYCEESCEFSKEMSRDLSTRESRKNLQSSDFFTPSESAFKSDCSRKECVDKAINFYENLHEYVKVVKENYSEALKNPSPEEEKENEEVEAVVKENLEKYRSCASSSGTSSNASSNANSNVSTPANNTKTEAGKDQSSESSESSDTTKMNASNILLFTIITLTLSFLF